ncbi:MAG: hypothetical protein HY646_12880 [Acidobacteria bacterium]|nr:hypothetical protein [Acidobacteriota bacterium]
MKTIQLTLFFFISSASASAQSADIIVGRLVNSMAVKNAQAFIERDQNRILTETASLETAGEADRFAEMLKAHGFSHVQIDSAGNVVGTRDGTQDQRLLTVMAHLKDARAMAAILASIRALDSERIRTGAGLLVVGLADRHAAAKTPAMNYILKESSFKDRIRYLVVVESREADRVSIAPKTIGSTIVQVALESIMTLGMKPYHEEEMSDRESALELRIPSIAIGCGYSTARGVQAVMTVVLAVAGIG